MGTLIPEPQVQVLSKIIEAISKLGIAASVTELFSFHPLRQGILVFIESLAGIVPQIHESSERSAITFHRLA